MWQFFSEKRLNDYKVDGVPTYAYYKQHLEKLPKIMIIHLKRFIYKDRAIKMKEDIYFPNVLNIDDQYVSQKLKLGAFTKVGEGRQYRLFSVVNHKGLYATSGHYVCFTLDSHNDWILFDDEKYRKVSGEVVSESQAYLLFYELIL